MARLPTGTPATPAKVRQATYRQALVAEGGRRVIADLGKPAADALGRLEAKGLTIKEAVSQGLILLAQQRKQ